MSKAAVIAVTDDFIKEINSLIYSFIWKGNDKIKRAALINDIENGGLRMLDIQSMIHSQRVMVLKKYADKEHISSWKTILDFFSLSSWPGFLFLRVILILESCPCIYQHSTKSV